MTLTQQNDPSTGESADAAVHELSRCDDPAGSERGDGFITRALHVLDTFGGLGTVYGVSELARRSGLPKSTTYRIVTQLLHGGYVRRVGSGYALSHHMFTLANHHQPGDARRGPRAIAAPHLGGLFMQTGLAVSFGILRGTEVVYVGQVQGPQTPVLPMTLGGRLPASTTALGKAILAFDERDRVRSVLSAPLPRLTRNSISAPGLLLEQLRATRERGIAFDRQESLLGFSCIAAPIIVPGEPVTAVSLCGPSLQLEAPILLRKLADTAAAIASDLARGVTARAS